ncbi:PREDICTED: 3-hydroxyisobutyryl-CoA hydrolase [Prunus dulcis]|uniref:3-hydroxyisobutyryl-CoA hydrolase n=1 Tax=Prunus dulcis TaxID=3755 RepID=A0A5E4E8R0_PRUDU|nr:PREDICTED: 3-hydroxyisobutyryl-CoA hydrolase [Prunus dulcis]
MLACGLATNFVPSAKLPLLEKALISRAASATSSSCDLASISAIIDEYSLQQPALNEKSAFHKMDVIDKCFSRPTVEQILSALEKEATTTDTNRADDPLEKEGCRQLMNPCPREYRITCHVLQGQVSKDCREGCRAILWGKDKKPKWKPSRLDLITDHMVDQCFSRLDGDEELKLPQRSNLPVFANAKL